MFFFETHCIYIYIYIRKQKCFLLKHRVVQINKRPTYASQLMLSKKIKATAVSSKVACAALLHVMPRLQTYGESFHINYTSPLVYYWN